MTYLFYDNVCHNVENVIPIVDLFYKCLILFVSIFWEIIVQIVVIKRIN